MTLGHRLQGRALNGFPAQPDAEGPAGLSDSLLKTSPDLHPLVASGGLFLMQGDDLLKKLLGLGLESKDLSFLQVSLRGLIVFTLAIVMVRLSDRRFLPHKTAFDAILFFMLASMLSRAINGGGPFFETIGVAFLLICLHRFLAFLAYRWHGFGHLIKGVDDLLVKEGKVIEDKLRRNNITQNDLLEELRLNGGVSSPQEIKEARYERSGDISVVKK